MVTVVYFGGRRSTQIGGSTPITTARKLLGELAQENDNRMEYQGVRYTLRAGIERGQWFVAIHPQGIEMAGKKVFGTREDAEFQAHLMISRWWLERRRQRSKLER
jgi:hypothetical protein